MATAWEDPEVRRQFRRARRTGRVFLAVAAGLVAVFWVSAHGMDDHAGALVAHGVHTTGVVLNAPGFAPRCGAVTIDVEFDVSGQRAVYPFWVSSCDHWTLNERVQVAYNPRNPSDFAVNGDESQTFGPSLLQGVALALGFTALLIWSIIALQLHRVRRILRHAAPVEWPARLTQLSRTNKGSRFVVQRVDEPGAPVLVTNRVGWIWGEPPDQRIVVTGPYRGWYLLHRAGPKWSYVHARVPKHAREIERVGDLVGGAPVSP